VKFKKHVIKAMREEGFHYRETARRFEGNDHHRIQDWERIYLTEEAEE
jgi:predicted fused transcriptional regulator/phosphomethylpyrimidine kinase